MQYSESRRYSQKHHVRLAGITLLGLALSACSLMPGAGTQPGEGDDDAAKVEARADAAMAGGSEDSQATVSKKAKKPAEPLPMVLAKGAEKDAKAARQQYEQALTALQSGRDDEALGLLRDLSNRYPNLSGPHLNQAILLRKKGRLEEARELLQKSMASGTQNPRVMNEYGVICRMLGDFAQAKSAYESAIRLAPGYDKAHYNLAVLADLYLDDTALAIHSFETYQSLQDTRDKKVDGWLKELKRRKPAS